MVQCKPLVRSLTEKVTGIRRCPVAGLTSAPTPSM